MSVVFSEVPCSMAGNAIGTVKTKSKVVNVTYVLFRVTTPTGSLTRTRTYLQSQSMERRRVRTIPALPPSGQPMASSLALDQNPRKRNHN